MQKEKRKHSKKSTFENCCKIPRKKYEEKKTKNFTISNTLCRAKKYEKRERVSFQAIVYIGNRENQVKTASGKKFVAFTNKSTLIFSWPRDNYGIFPALSLRHIKKKNERNAYLFCWRLLQLFFSASFRLGFLYFGLSRSVCFFFRQWQTIIKNSIFFPVACIRSGKNTRSQSKHR